MACCVPSAWVHGTVFLHCIPICTHDVLRQANQLRSNWHNASVSASSCLTSVLQLWLLVAFHVALQLHVLTGPELGPVHPCNSVEEKAALRVMPCCSAQGSVAGVVHEVVRSTNSSSTSRGTSP